MRTTALGTTTPRATTPQDNYPRRTTTLCQLPPGQLPLETSTPRTITPIIYIGQLPLLVGQLPPNTRQLPPFKEYDIFQVITDLMHSRL